MEERVEDEQSVSDSKLVSVRHYGKGRKYEPWRVIRDWKLNFNLGNVVKYVARAGRKEGNSAVKDLKKARDYLDFEIAAIEEENCD